MTMDRHDMVASRLDEYALGQLSPKEQREVEAHVQECTACEAVLRELTAVMEGIGSTAEVVDLPDGLKRRVLDALAVTPRPIVGRRSWNTTWLAAAATVILAVGGLLYIAESGRRRAASDIQRAERLVTDLQRRLADYAGQTDRALSILTSADMREIPLAGRNAAATSAARAYWSPTRGLLLVADRLPTPPPGRIYQVWVIGGGQPMSAGLLGARTEGRGMLIAPPPGSVVSGAVTIAVTDEPPGGLAAPTGSMHLVGSL